MLLPHDDVMGDDGDAFRDLFDLRGQFFVPRRQKDHVDAVAELRDEPREPRLDVRAFIRRPAPAVGDAHEHGPMRPRAALER